MLHLVHLSSENIKGGEIFMSCIPFLKKKRISKYKLCRVQTVFHLVLQHLSMHSSALALNLLANLFSAFFPFIQFPLFNLVCYLLVDTRCSAFDNLRVARCLTFAYLLSAAHLSGQHSSALFLWSRRMILGHQFKLFPVFKITTLSAT